MKVKLTGAEMNAFMTDQAVWDGGKWYDDLYAEVDGVEHDLDLDFEKDLLPPGAKVVVEGGCLYRSDAIGAPFDDFDKVLKRWLKSRTTSIVTLEVPNEQVDALKAYLTTISGKVAA